jgi:hypothetical protein
LRSARLASAIVTEAATAQLVHLDKQANRDRMVLLAHQARLEPLDLMATSQRSTTITNDAADIAHMDLPAHPEPLESAEPPELLAQLAQLETTLRMDHLDQLAIKDKQDLTERLVKTENKEHLEITAPKEARVKMAQPDQMDLLARRENEDEMAPLETKEDRAVQDLLDLLEKMDQLDRTATQVHLVQMAHLARMPPTAPAPVVLSSTRSRRHKQIALRMFRRNQIQINLHTVLLAVVVNSHLSIFPISSSYFLHLLSTSVL